MDAKTLAMNARIAAEKLSHGILSRAIVAQLELGHVAWWLDQQDEEHRAKAANTACAAMHLLRTLP